MVLGTKEYGELVREPLIGLVEILKIFESCQPPVERVLGKKKNKITFFKLTEVVVPGVIRIRISQTSSDLRRSSFSEFRQSTRLALWWGN